MSSSIIDILDNTLSPKPKSTRPHKKHTEETRAKISLAAKTRDPEKVREIMGKIGRKPKRMTEKRLANLRRQQETLASREDSSKGGKTTMSKPENRRKILRHLTNYRNLTDEEFEEKMKEMDKKYEQQQQTSD